MQFPLRFSFKILGFAPQIYVYDSTDSEVFYVKQKLFKLKEDISVFRTSAQQDLVAQIKADRIMDFSACYHFHVDGDVVGAVRRKGMRSIFKAEYHVLDSQDLHELTITEDSAMVKVVDGIVGGIPLIGFLLAMFINPSYTVKDLDGKGLFQVHKKPAFFEGKFELTKLSDTTPEIEQRSLLAVMMMLLLERSRG
ncbi:MAG: hypothetical protein R3F61_18030 [Myxococcota bacterium]